MRSANPERIGILLVNSGTPQAAEPRAVRAFLARFLADPRVVELPRALWLPLLYGVILPWRPRRIARKYRLIWTAGGSPLRNLSERLRAELASSLAQRMLAPLALAAGAALHRGLSRASGLHRCAARQCHRALAGSRPHGSPADFLSWHSGTLRPPGRPVLLPLPDHGAPARRRTAVARRGVERELSVALWSDGLAEALHPHGAHRDAGPRCARGHPGVSGFCRGLPGDARGDRYRKS